ncbi:hypothetical protein [Xanthovirga aplysinae]|uniref:hypothetical protein n=1 Tax=Xanthovirga aplysinae TaxID=2529853 RepID=UPI0012BB514D|nr:hypothetical protein [Xanthovirga aplysinae]MTI30874.1 hypothetical protein [Xanthovirga aplysinae]
MKSFKKSLRLIGLIFLMLLASVGFGLMGVAPIQFSNKRRDFPETTVELVESEGEEKEVNHLEFKEKQNPV